MNTNNSLSVPVESKKRAYGDLPLKDCAAENQVEVASRHSKRSKKSNPIKEELVAKHSWLSKKSEDPH
jgi:hypothetical protein